MTAIFNVYGVSALFQRFYHLAIQSILPAKFLTIYFLYDDSSPRSQAAPRVSKGALHKSLCVSSSEPLHEPEQSSGDGPTCPAATPTTAASTPCASRTQTVTDRRSAADDIVTSTESRHRETRQLPGDHVCQRCCYSVLLMRSFCQTPIPS